MRAERRGRRNPSSPRGKRYWDFSEKKGFSPLDVLLDWLAPLDGLKEDLESVSKHDYNFGTLLVLIGVAFLACTAFGLGCFLAALIIFA